MNNGDGIDVLVQLVGGYAGGKSVVDSDDAAFDQMMNVNVRTSFHMFRAVLPLMRAQGSGRILAIGSRAAVEPSPKIGLYGASKAALVSLVRGVAAENADHKITANVILPGTMDTPANRAAMPSANFSQWVPPAQVASLLVHLGERRCIGGQWRRDSDLRNGRIERAQVLVQTGLGANTALGQTSVRDCVNAVKFFHPHESH